MVRSATILTESVLEHLSKLNTKISLFFNKKEALLGSKPTGFTLIGTVKASTDGINNIEWSTAL